MPNSTKAPYDCPQMPKCCEIVGTVTYSYLPTRVNFRPICHFCDSDEVEPFSLIDYWPAIAGLIFGGCIVIGAYLVSYDLFALLVSGAIFGMALILGLGIGFKLLNFMFNLTDRWS